MLELPFECNRKYHKCNYIRIKKPQRAYKGISPEEMLILEEEENDAHKKLKRQK